MPALPACGPATNRRWTIFPGDIVAVCLGSFLGGVSLVTGVEAVKVVSAEAAPRTAPVLDLAAWPSPDHDLRTVRATTHGDVATLALIDVLGWVVRTEPVEAGADGREVRLDVSGVAPGVYALRLTPPRVTRGHPVVIGR